jgi:ankyrin repeat protein
MSERNRKCYPLSIAKRRERYDMQIISAIRAKDIEALRAIAKIKHLQCCNRFGESIVHTACRRGSANVIRFLLQNDVNIRVASEQGRTPLHDTCWTTQINFESVEILLEIYPDFLYITDDRNLTPLSYMSMKEQRRGPWNHFLEEHPDLLLTKYLTFD